MPRPLELYCVNLCGAEYSVKQSTLSHLGQHTRPKDHPTLKAASITASGTTLHIKPGIDVPVPLVNKVLHMHRGEMEPDKAG